jgi:hypothetical protein
MVDTKAVANINPVDFMARLEPEQQKQLFKIQGAIDFEYQKRQTSLDIENSRLVNSQWLANQEHQNKLSEIQYQADREDQRVAMKGQTAAALADKNHENQLERMQVELQNQMTLAEHNTGLAVITTLMEENGKVRISALTRMEQSHMVRDEIFKMHTEALIQEKQAQKQHKRDLEKMQHESNLKQSEQFFQSICLRLSKLLDNSDEEKMKEEIAQLHAMWVKEENKDD